MTAVDSCFTVGSHVFDLTEAGPDHGPTVPSLTDRALRYKDELTHGTSQSWCCWRFLVSDRCIVCIGVTWDPCKTSMWATHLKSHWPFDNLSIISFSKVTPTQERKQFAFSKANMQGKERSKKSTEAKESYSKNGMRGAL